MGVSGNDSPVTAGQHSSAEAVEDIEIQLLLEGVFQRYGFDFRHYAQASIRRRIRHCMREERVGTVSELQNRILHNVASMERFLLILSVNVTALFRDAGFYLAFREKVVPWLRTYPFIRIWHVGCSTGEEVYSTAILLQEEGLYERVRLYATDMNEVVLARARDGVYALDRMNDYAQNYLKAGGKRSLADYYTAQYERAIFHAGLKKNIVWAQHNLTSECSFNEFHVIVCRNVMIYFDQTLQARVHELLYESLTAFGMLGMGQKETVRFSPFQACYEELDAAQKWYRKVR
jgi:chemotaxis protein methyltransferase CheR